jgi:hypothetical protein
MLLPIGSKRRSFSKNYNTVLTGAMIGNAPTLAYLMDKCQILKTLTLKKHLMKYRPCTWCLFEEKPSLEIVLISCQLTSAGISAQSPGTQSGPTKLHFKSLALYLQ